MAILKTGALLGVAALYLSSCVQDTPPNPIPAPELSRITVFFPLDGLVNGRGSPGPVPAGYKFVYVKPHPSRNVDSFAIINGDGSFNFRIAATGNDVLELAFTTTDNPLAPRGAPTFVEVPLQPAAPQSFYCCVRPQAQNGRCQPTTELICVDNIVAPMCASDGDCAYLSGDHIQVEKGDFTITPPNAEGRITVRSTDPAFALNLIRFENRGQRGIGGVDPQFRNYVIADENGVAESTFKARGDDEIVVRAFALNGYVRSREHQLIVPDSPLVGLDVVGVFPFEGLQKGKRGKIGIRFAPYGLDQRGICPPSSDSGVALCFSGGHEDSSGKNSSYNGGLDYNMLRVSMTIDGNPVGMPSEPMGGGVTKFTDGDVLAPPVSIVVIIDDSEDSEEANADGGRLRFRAVENFLRSVRTRDKVAVISTGTHPMGIREGAGYSVRSELGGRDAAIQALLNLGSTSPAGTNNINSALVEAGKMLTAQGLATNGRIVVVSAAQPVPDTVTADAALTAVTEDPDRGRSAYPVYVIARKIDLNAMNGTQARNELDTVAGFTGGSFVEVVDPTEFVTRVAEVAGRVSGAFVLQYEVTIPEQSGTKLARVSLDATLTLPDTTPGATMADKQVTTRFEGDLELRDNPAF